MDENFDFTSGLLPNLPDFFEGKLTGEIQTADSLILPELSA